MVSSKIFFMVVILLFSSLLFQCFLQNVTIFNHSILAGFELPDHPSFNSVAASASTGYHLARTKKNALKPSEETVPKEENDADDNDGDGIRRTTPLRPSVKLHLKHRSANQGTKTGRKESVIESTYRDWTRIQTLRQRIIEKRQQLLKPVISSAASSESGTGESADRLEATLKSGVSLGSGEYFIDVFVGTPPNHFSLILDTGSDLNWIQCLPCHDCFEMNGPPYNPRESSSFRNISCHDPRCNLVSSPDPPQPCKLDNQTCPYFYGYGDISNTTGDFGLETFTVNLTTPTGKSVRQVENVMFGCGHWNRGKFHGAAGLLGLGRGPLSFSSQLQSLYGPTFSYCLVDRNSDFSVSSKLIFGEDQSLMSHPNLTFTSFVTGKGNPVDTFYYVQIKSIMVGGEILDIPEQTWQLSEEGAGGTIIDSGTTSSYFIDPAYQIIKEAFIEKVKSNLVLIFVPLLDLCFNVSGVEKVELPGFAILFEDGAVWNFPVENYFIRLDPEEIVCLVIFRTPPSSPSTNLLSILGNYQQQNFHVVYDSKKSRLGFAPMRCADV